MSDSTSALERAEKAARAKDKLKKFQAKKKAHEPPSGPPQGSSSTLAQSGHQASIQVEGNSTIDPTKPFLDKAGPENELDPQRLPDSIQSTSGPSFGIRPATALDGVSDAGSGLAAMDTSASHQRTISLLVDEKSMLNSELHESRKEIVRLNDRLDESQQKLTAINNHLTQELEHCQASLSDARLQLQGSAHATANLQTELDSARTELDAWSQNQSNGVQELVTDYEAKLRMKQSHSDAVESELSRVQNLLQSRENHAQEQVQVADRLKEEVGALKQQLEQADRRSNDTAADLEALRGHHSEVQAQLSSSQSQLQQSQALLLSFESHSESMSSQLSNLQNSHDALAGELSSLQIKLAESNLRKESLQKDNQSLLDSLEELRFKLVELTDSKLQSGDRLEELRKIVRERENELVTMRKELTNERKGREEEKQELERQASSLQQRIELQEQMSLQCQLAHQAVLDQLKVDSASLTDRLQHAQENLDLSSHQLRETLTALEQSKAQIDVLTLEKSKLEAECLAKEVSLKSNGEDLQRLQGEVYSYIKDLDLEKKQKAELEDQNLKSTSELRTLQSDLDKANQKLSSSQRETEKERERGASLTTQVQKVECRAEELQTELLQTHDALKSLQSELDSATLRLLDAHKALELKGEENRVLVESLKSNEADVSELRGLLDDSRSKNDALSNQIDQLNSAHELEIESSRQQLADAEHSAREKLDGYQKQLSGLKEHLPIFQSRLEEAERESKSLKERLEVVQSQKVECTASVARLSEKLNLVTESSNSRVEQMRLESEREKIELGEEIKRLRTLEQDQKVLNEQLMTTISDLESRSRSAQHDLRSLRSEHEQIQAELGVCQSDLSEKRQSLASALHDLVTEKNTCADLDHKLSERKIEVESLLKAKESLQAEVKTQRDCSNQAIHAAQQKLELQEEQLTQCTQRIVELQEETSKSDQQKSELIKQMKVGKEGENRILENSRKEIVDLKRKVNQLKEEGDTLRRGLSQTKLEFEQHDRVKEGEINSLNEELKELKQLKDALEQTNATVMEEKATSSKALQATIGEMEKNVSAQVNEIMALSAKLENLEQQEQSAKSDSLHAQQVAERELAAQATQNAELRSTLESTKLENEVQLKATQEQLAVIKRELDTTRTSREQLQGELENLRLTAQFESEKDQRHAARPSQQEVELKELKSSLASKEEDCVKLGQKCEELQHSEVEAKKMAQAMRETISELKSEVEGLKVQTEHSSAEQAKINQDYIDSILQQHAIDLSTARSQIRLLESQVFEAESKSHEMLTRIESLQDQLRGTESRLKENPIQFSQLPSLNSRSSSVELNKATGSSPNNSPQSVVVVNPATSNVSVEPSANFMIDESHLSAQTRHHRRQSLNLLKTRMQSELGLTSSGANLPHGGSDRKSLDGFQLLDSYHPPTTYASSSSLSSITERPDPHERVDQVHGRHIIRSSKLGDDMVWCGDCVGDLFVI